MIYIHRIDDDKFKNPLSNGIHYAIHKNQPIDDLELISKIKSIIESSQMVNYPPAGFSRGCLGVNCSEDSIPINIRDNLYQVGINPIIYHPVLGLVIWGQKFIKNHQVYYICDRNGFHKEFLDVFQF